jgi:CTP:molybdopterin cytidylyltransferase MocA
MPMPSLPIAAIILAAGSSNRMGTPKALLRHASGTSFARYLLNCFGLYGCSPVILVVAAGNDFPELHMGSHILVVNQNPEKGRSHSIHLGIQYIPPGFACFIHNVDNPFLSPELLDELVSRFAPGQYTVPVFQGRGGHPVLLGRCIVDVLKKSDPSVDFRETLNDFARVEAPFNSGQILININTQQDFTQYRRPGMEKNI